MTRTFTIALIGALVLGGIIVGLNRAARRADNGALQAECGVLLPYPEPMDVYVDGSAYDWDPHVARAIARWQHASGVQLFGQTYTVAPSGSFVGADVDTFACAFADRGPEPVGRVLVVSSAVAEYLVADASDTAGHARLRWNPRTCRIGYAVIVLPEADLSEDERRVIAEHEIGHVLGLAHDPSPSSVMHHETTPGAQITERDAALVRSRASPY